MLNPEINKKLLDACGDKLPELDEATAEALLQKCSQIGLTRENLDFNHKALLLYVTMLLEQKPDVNCHDPENGETPLIKSAMQCNFGLAQILLDSGAAVNLTDRNLGTALHAAAASNSFELASLLLERKANHLALDNRRMLPLHYSIHCPQLVGLLLQLGSAVDAQCIFGNTTLHIAAKFGAPIETLIILLAHGADYTIENSDKQTALTAANQLSAYPQLMALLAQKDNALKLKSKELSVQAKVSFLLGRDDSGCAMTQTSSSFPAEMFRQICLLVNYKSFERRAFEQLKEQTANPLDSKEKKTSGYFL